MPKRAATTWHGLIRNADGAPRVHSRPFGGKDGLVEALLIIGFDRLRAAVEADTEPGRPVRLRASGLRYREFALANPHFYAIMFEDALKGMVLTPDPAATYRALLETIIRGLAP